MYNDKIYLTPQEILDHDFKIDARGYRPQEVDKFLDLVGVAEHDENNITARKDIKCKTPKEEWSDVELNTLNMLLEQSLRIVESHNCEPEGTIDTTECHLRKYLSKANGCVDTIKTVGIVKD